MPRRLMLLREGLEGLAQGGSLSSNLATSVNENADSSVVSSPDVLALSGAVKFGRS